MGTTVEPAARRAAQAIKIHPADLEPSQLDTEVARTLASDLPAAIAAGSREADELAVALATGHSGARVAQSVRRLRELADDTQAIRRA